MKQYKNILLKLSGEVLMGDSPSGLDANQLTYYADEIQKAYQLGIAITIVIGGGNLHRGSKKAKELAIDQIQSDYMGMLATVINGIALQNTLTSRGIDTRHMSSISISPICEPYVRQKAIDQLKKKKILIISAGLGIPCFTTDSAASLRAIELGAEVMLKGTKVHGIYTKDPQENIDAVLYKNISFQEAYQKNLAVLDKTAFALCEANSLPIIVFNATQPNNLLRIIQGEHIGTIVQ